ncbi:hypothetical protein PAPYR_11358 [Paratrimastix pyriformis]|uniref:Uncharacterized protein n=1 Tax=Paratrimastix pyriformis TaxID=342808 RepID=A0ABQ8U9L8_9EUKA|nr:hypothetical protein PAPYR_11358 [Paratrimastix pyriformis]
MMNGGWAAMTGMLSDLKLELRIVTINRDQLARSLEARSADVRRLAAQTEEAARALAEAQQAAQEALTQRNEAELKPSCSKRRKWEGKAPHVPKYEVSGHCDVVSLRHGRGLLATIWLRIPFGACLLRRSLTRADDQLRTSYEILSELAAHTPLPAHLTQRLALSAAALL